MTRRAELLARLARLAAEQAEVLGELAQIEEPSAPKPTKRPRRVPPLSVVPDEPVSEIARARARRALRRYGVPLAEE